MKFSRKIHILEAYKDLKCTNRMETQKGATKLPEGTDKSENRMIRFKKSRSTNRECVLHLWVLPSLSLDDSQF